MGRVPGLTTERRAFSRSVPRPLAPPAPAWKKALKPMRGGGRAEVYAFSSSFSTSLRSSSFPVGPGKVTESQVGVECPVTYLHFAAAATLFEVSITQNSAHVLVQSYMSWTGCGPELLEIFRPTAPCKKLRAPGNRNTRRQKWPSVFPVSVKTFRKERVM